MHSKYALFAVSGFYLFMASMSWAAPPTSITLDGSMGHGSGPVSPTSPGFYNITPSMGTVAGSNIFHSFGTFNLGTGDTADFVANAGTQNIIARVTGGSASSIDGTITSTVGIGGPLSSANLFLVNPAGIMFTSNASLNLNGAFVASTANSVKLSDGTIFYADTLHPINDGDLTSAPVSAFGFMPASGQTPAPISFAGTPFTNAAGLHVIGGNLTLDQGATLLAPGGNLTLFSAAGAGSVPFSLASPGTGFGSATTGYGNITMQNQSAVAIDSAQGGGSLVIRGGQIVVSNSTVSSVNSGSAAGGGISVQADTLKVQAAGEIIAETTGAGDAGSLTVTATDGVTILNGSFISGTTFGGGNAGTVTVSAASLTVDGTMANGAATGIFSEASPGSTGNAGAMSVQVGGELSLANGGEISSSTWGPGNGGDITIRAGSLNLDGRLTNVATGIFSAALFGSTGNAGKAEITVSGDTTIANTAEISSSTNGAGNAEGVMLQTQTLEITSPATSQSFTGIISNAQVDSTGNGGQISVAAAGGITVSGPLAGISSSTLGPGAAGSVTVTAASLSLDESNAPNSTDLTGIYSNSESSDASVDAPAGPVAIDVTGELSITGGAQISSNTNTAGNAGTIEVTAGTLDIDGSAAPNAFTGISSSSEIGSSGNAGDITVNVGGLMELTREGRIITNTFSSGNGGEITVHAATLTINDSAGPNDAFFTGIASASDEEGQANPGNAGSVTVEVAGALDLTSGKIDTNTNTSGNAGDVQVTASSLRLDGSATPNTVTEISSSANGGASSTGASGNVGLNVAGLLSVTGGGVIDAETSTAGKGGNINVKAGAVLLDDGGTPQLFDGVTAQAKAGGNGGEVTMTAGNVTVEDGAAISASSAASNAGDILVTAANLTLTSHGRIETQAAGDGGAITLNVRSLLYMFESEIASVAHGGTSTTAGDITIASDLVALDESVISANDLSGSGGRISITANDYLNQFTPITATGGVSNGDISISAPDLNLSGSLLPLPGQLISDDNKLKENCARSINHEFSSLIVVGRGGTEPAPDELQPDFGLEQTVRAAGR
jgi:filamentous hemagglutinin family protein